MLLRLWLTLGSGLLKPRVSVFDECSLAFRVWPNDIDVNLHLTNNRYLRAMDLGRWDLGMRTGLNRTILERRWLPTVGSATLRFRRGLSPFQRYELRTRLAAWDEKWCWFEQRFCVGETLHAIGRVKVLFRGSQGNVPTCELLAACGAGGAPTQNVPEHVRLWQQAEAAERAAAPIQDATPRC
jgi:acyl-CoA thioesterase FadM